MLARRMFLQFGGRTYEKRETAVIGILTLQLAACHSIVSKYFHSLFPNSPLATPTCCMSRTATFTRGFESAVSGMALTFRLSAKSWPVARRSFCVNARLGGRFRLLLCFWYCVREHCPDVSDFLGISCAFRYQ